MRALAGGKKIGEGGQGCVFSPPLYSVRAPFPLVSKVAEHGNAKPEYVTAMKLKALDPQGQYGMYPVAPWHCHVTRQQILANDPTLKPSDAEDEPCGNMVTVGSQSNYCSIEYERFHQTLEDMIEASKRQRAKLATVRAMAHVWASVKFLRQHGFVHGDLKADNVARRKTGNLFLMDWGWSEDLSRCASAMELLRMMVGYPEYVVPQHGGDANGIWSPLLRSQGPAILRRQDCAKARYLLHVNDVYSVAYMTLKAITALKLRLPELTATLLAFLDRPQDLYVAGPAAIEAFHARIVSGLEKPE